MSKQGIFMSLAEDSTEARIDVIGVIGWEVAYQSLRDMLAAIPQTVKRVTFDIFSPGGDVWEGNGIVHEIGELGKRVETVARVQVAASMATLIAIACNKRSIASNGRWLIHNAWTQTTGDAATHEKTAKTLRDCEAEAAKLYASRTGKSEADMLALMAEERWLMPEETKALGFVDEVSDPFDTEAKEQVKAEIIAAGKWPKALVELPKEETKDAHIEPVANTEQPAPVVAPSHVPAADVKETDAYKLGFKDGQEVAGVTFKQEYDGKLLESLKEWETLIAASEALARKHQSDKDAGIAMAKAEHAKEMMAACAIIEDIKSQMAAEKLSAENKINALKGQLEISGARLSKLLAGSLTYSPELQTWAEAMAACKDDLAEARVKYPELYKAYMAAERQKGK